MRLNSLPVVLAATLIVAALSGAAAAQTAPSGQTGPIRGTMRPGSTGDTLHDQVAERVNEADRTARTPEPRRRRGGRPSAAEITAGAEAAVASAGLQCQVVQAAAVGQSDAGAVYEVACVDGPGRLILASTPPQAFNCLALEASVAGGGDASTQCDMAVNKDPVAAMKGYAQALSIGCPIDQAAWIGQLATGADRYEVGCPAAAGFWIEVSPSGAPLNKTPCAEVVQAHATCRFTTAEELASGR